MEVFRPSWTVNHFEIRHISIINRDKTGVLCVVVCVWGNENRKYPEVFFGINKHHHQIL